MKLFFQFSIVLLSIFCLPINILATAQSGMNNSQEGEVSSPPASTKAEPGVGQEQTNNPYAAYNKNSIHPILEPTILFRKRVWREIYLQELKNKPFFSRGAEITSFIIQAVKEGILIPYTDETLITEMSKEQFLENLSLPQDEQLSAQEKALGFTEDSGWDDAKNSASTKKGHAGKASEKVAEYFLPNEVTTLEIMEDVIFEKISSTFIYDIQTVKLIIPAEKFATGLRKNVGVFKYKDLAAYFDSQPKAVWVNVKNNAGNIKLTEAIELRLFDARIIKVENPDDLTLEDIYTKTPESSLYASQKMQEELIELEQFLWEN